MIFTGISFVILNKYRSWGCTNDTPVGCTGMFLDLIAGAGLIALGLFTGNVSDLGCSFGMVLGGSLYLLGLAVVIGYLWYTAHHPRSKVPSFSA